MRAEMGIYWHIYSAIVIGDNLLPINVIAQNSFDLSIINIAFVIYFIIAINEYSCLRWSKLVNWRSVKNYTESMKFCCNLKTSFCFVSRHGRARELFAFLEKFPKVFLQFDFQKHFVKHFDNLPQHLSEKFIGDSLSITDIGLRNWGLSAIKAISSYNIRSMTRCLASMNHSLH